MNTYKEILIQSGLYSYEQLEGRTEEDCKAEYQEITIGGET